MQSATYSDIMVKIKRIATFILCLSLIFVIGGELILSLFSLKAEAAEKSYSNVLADLKKDKSFSPDNYPQISDDYSLRVIQIAEGDNGELFIYVYQPSDEERDYKAKYINMSLQNRTDKSPAYSLYSLTWVNSDGVFDKYIVNDFRVKSDLYRYYNIAAIYREYDSSVDDKYEAIDGMNCKGYTVGQVWCAYYYNGVLMYEMEEVEVVEIDVKASGSIRYSEGFKLYVDRCDSNYVAFSIENYNVDKIYDADITYTYRSKTWSFVTGVGEKTTYGEAVTKTKRLSEYDTASNDGDGLFGKKYTWNRIQTEASFIEEATNDANESFSSEELAALQKAEYVFRFLETDYTISGGMGSTYEYSTEVSGVGILRLHFLSEGKVYNLGCVSDLVSIDGNPELSVDNIDNIMNSIEEQEWWQKLMMVLALILIILVCTVLAGPLGLFFNLIFGGVRFIVQCILTVLTIPFQLIGLLFKRNG